MALLDTIGKKLTETGQTALKGTKNFAEITKLNTMIADEQRRISDAYEKIGQQYYAANAANPGTDYAAFCALVTDGLEKVAAYQAKILAIKEINVCPHCGTEVKGAIKFCSSCGTSVNKAESPENE